MRKQIKQLQDKITDNINYLSAGGCGFFAYYMSQRLTELGIKHEIIIIHRRSHSGRTAESKKVLNNLKDYDNGEKIATSFIHAFIRSKSIDFDGEDFEVMNSWSREYAEDGSYTTKEMKTALRVGGWNKAYNRSNNRKLKRYIKKFTI